MPIECRQGLNGRHGGVVLTYASAIGDIILELYTIVATSFLWAIYHRAMVIHCLRISQKTISGRLHYDKIYLILLLVALQKVYEIIN